MAAGCFFMVYQICNIGITFFYKFLLNFAEQFKWKWISKTVKQHNQQ